MNLECKNIVWKEIGCPAVPRTLDRATIAGAQKGYLCSLFFFSSRRRHTRLQGDWSSDVCSSDLVKRPGQPQDLDAAVVFLAAESSRYVTGQTLLVDGGISTGATRALVQSAHAGK